MTLIKKAIQKSLGCFGLKLVRVESDVGMHACLAGLKHRGFDPDCILDIGAARGEWTKSAMRYWPDAKYYLIEPLEEHLQTLTLLKCTHRNINYILACAGPSDGEASIGVTKELDGSSLLYDGVFARTVPMRKVDSLLQEHIIDQPRFMKLDVQGYELRVLEGARTVMEGCELILLELQFFRFSPSMKLMHESIAWMAEQGYRPYEIVDTMRRPFDMAMGQCDILFAREGNPLLASIQW